VSTAGTAHSHRIVTRKIGADDSPKSLVVRTIGGATLEDSAGSTIEKLDIPH
jgi:hypothetical protein